MAGCPTEGHPEGGRLMGGWDGETGGQGNRKAECRRQDTYLFVWFFVPVLKSQYFAACEMKSDGLASGWMIGCSDSGAVGDEKELDKMMATKIRIACFKELAVGGSSGRSFPLWVGTYVVCNWPVKGDGQTGLALWLPGRVVAVDCHQRLPRPDALH